MNEYEEVNGLIEAVLICTRFTSHCDDLLLSSQIFKMPFMSYKEVPKEIVHKTIVKTCNFNVLHIHAFESNYSMN